MNHPYEFFIVEVKIQKSYDDPNPRINKLNLLRISRVLITGYKYIQIIPEHSEDHRRLID